jgi:hypothetical protein
MSIDEVVSSLKFVKQQAEQAYDLVSASHRHKNISFAGCTECELRRRVEFINRELGRILKGKVVWDGGAT